MTSPAFPPANLAPLIDHTLLKAEATEEEVRLLIDEGRHHGFAALCINGAHVRLAAKALAGCPVKVASVAGFPLGACTSAAKAIEAAEVVRLGAMEVDFVAFLPDLLKMKQRELELDFAQVMRSVRKERRDAVVKVILETAVLAQGVTEELAEQRIAVGCRAAALAGCDYVKTSTGFHPSGGATEWAVRMLKKHAPGLKVKAAGGIRTRPQALAMIAAGADRLGCSASVAIVSSE